jgi:hypothetical protein
MGRDEIGPQDKKADIETENTEGWFQTKIWKQTGIWKGARRSKFH